MKITICGSIKFIDQIKSVKKKLEALGHQVLIPIKIDGVDYWSESNFGRVEAKKKYGLIEEHVDKIEKSDAILVLNITKDNIKNYIGANTFLEIGFAYYKKRKIFLLNSIPDQSYIIDELEAMQPIIINGDLSLIK